MGQKPNQQPHNNAKVSNDDLADVESGWAPVELVLGSARWGSLSKQQRIGCAVVRLLLFWVVRALPTFPSVHVDALCPSQIRTKPHRLRSPGQIIMKTLQATGLPPFLPALKATFCRNGPPSRRPSGVGRRFTVSAQTSGTKKVAPQQVKLRLPSGDDVVVDKVELVVGSASGTDLLMEGPNVGDEHARIELKQGRVYCTALVGEEGSLTAESYTWIDGNPIRPGIAYMLSPGSNVAIGEESNSLKLDFEETGGASWVVENMVKMMANQCTDEGKQEVEKLFSDKE
ncbi:hypothetical protein BSKO_04275 [Bryopsis sp. KO-2023]|nr:hypothetical protein BSKO_04275 [Bryopsis sp. KO-2023]